MITERLRKAAILVRSLDGDTAATLLARLQPEEARRMRTALGDVRRFGAEEQSDVATEFFQARQARPDAGNSPEHAADAGVEVAWSDTAAAAVTAEGEAAPALALDAVDERRLSSLLAGEQPQTIAVAMARLDARKAAGVLGELPAATRADVLNRLADSRGTDDQTRRVIEDQLAKRALELPPPDAELSTAVHRQGTRSATGGLPLRKTVDASQREEREPATSLELPLTEPADLGPSSPEKTETVPTALPEAPPTSAGLSFAELSRVDTATLARILADVPPPVLLLALTGADKRLVDRVTSELPWRARRKFRWRLSQLGPTRLSDITRAQETVAQVASAALRGGTA